jgi:diacylglycerol kinase family enzyme
MMDERHLRPLRRLLALVALGALVAALLVLFVGVIGNLGAVLVALAGLLLAVLGSWDWLTRIGTARHVALVLAVLGVGVLLAGLVWADLSAGRFGAMVLLALAAVGSARVALGKGERDARAAAATRPAEPAARRGVLIMNLKSGGGKAERFHLVDECRTRGIEPVVLHPGDDLLVLAQDAVAHGADVIGMAGGDGSQALVASVAARHDVPFVVEPAGTRNHFALDLGLDRANVVGALDAFSDGVEHRVDLASVNGRIFVNNATLGLYARIVQSPEYRDAKRETAAALLPELLGPDAPGMDLRFVGPDGVPRTTADVILVSNNPYELDRSAGRGTREVLDRGLLGIATVAIDDARAAAQLVSLELAGQVQRYKGWLEWTAQRFEVAADEPVEVGVDGEALRMDPPLVFESLPGVLRVRLPRTAGGRSPAARAVHLASRSTVAALGRIAGGHDPRAGA